MNRNVYVCLPALLALLPAFSCRAVCADEAAGIPEIHFLGGKPSHGWGQHAHGEGCRVLADALNKSGLSVRAVVHTNGWDASRDALRNARALVIYSDGGSGHLARGHVADLRALWERGVGLGLLHYALEPSDGEMAALFLDTVGGRFEPHWSVNPIWTPVGLPQLTSHPVTRGVEPFALRDEWYYHMRFRPEMRGVTALMSALPPQDSVTARDDPYSGNPAVRADLEAGVPQAVAWASVDERGRRGLGFTGGHFHANWAHDGYRRLVLNGIVWIAGVSPPETGVTSETPLIVRNQTLLRAVALDDGEDVTRHLLLGAAVNEQSATGWTPLHHAAVRRRPSAVRVLLEHGAAANTQTQSGKTALHFCADRGFLELAELLVRYGAKVAVKDQEGWTALHFAAVKDRTEMVCFLITEGADVNAVSNGGGTPLHEAAASASAAMIDLLLQNGADKTLKAVNGKTAYDYAAELGNEAAAARLKDDRWPD